MTTVFRLEMLAIALVLFVVVLRSIRSRKLLVRFSLVWFMIAVGILLIAVFPCIPVWLCSVVQIETPSNLIYLLGILVLFMLALSQTRLLSQQTEQIKRLTQELSLERLRREEERAPQGGEGADE